MRSQGFGRRLLPFVFVAFGKTTQACRIFSPPSVIYCGFNAVLGPWISLSEFKGVSQ
jgi:hypothetical protein